MPVRYHNPARICANMCRVLRKCVAPILPSCPGFWCHFDTFEQINALAIQAQEGSPAQPSPAAARLRRFRPAMASGHRNDGSIRASIIGIATYSHKKPEKIEKTRKKSKYTKKVKIPEKVKKSETSHQTRQKSKKSETSEKMKKVEKPK